MEVNINAPQQGGKFTKKVKCATSDRATPLTYLECELAAKVAVKVEPINVNFGTVRRDTTELKRSVTVRRADGGLITPKVVSTSNAHIKAELIERTAGEVYDLEVTLVPPLPAGGVHGSIVLETGIEKSPRAIVNVTASIPTRLSAIPSRLTLRTVPKEDFELRSRLVWSDDKPGNVTKVASSDAALETRFEEQNGDQYVIVKIPAGYKPSGGMGSLITVETDDPDAATLRIPLSSTSAPTRSPGVTPRVHQAPAPVGEPAGSSTASRPGPP